MKITFEFSNEIEADSFLCCLCGCGLMQNKCKQNCETCAGKSCRECMKEVGNIEIEDC